VNIVDATSGAKARVSSTGQLYNVNVDPASGARSKVDATGKQLVGDGSGALSIDGAVSATAPAKPLFKAGYMVADGSVFTKWGAGRTAITDLVLSQSNDAGSIQSVGVKLHADGGNGDCSTLGGLLVDLGFFDVVHNDTPLVVNFTTPVVGTSPSAACLWLNAPGAPGTFVRYQISGFDI
jgi:hypothetical protein